MTEGRVRGDTAAPIIALLARPRRTTVRIPGPLIPAPVFGTSCRGVSAAPPEPVARSTPGPRPLQAVRPADEPRATAEGVPVLAPVPPKPDELPPAAQLPPAPPPAGALPPVAYAATQTDVPDDGPAPEVRRRGVARVAVAALAVAALVILLGAGTVIVRHELDTPSHSSAGPIAPQPTTGPALDPPAAEAGDWAVANLAPADRLVVSAALRPTLTGRGFPSQNLVTAADFTGSDRRTDLVVDAGLTTTASDTPALAQAVQASEPLAVFGTGADTVEVRQVLSLDAAQSLTVDAAARATAGRGLARNPNLTASQTIRQTLTDGQLDLRAATVLAVLAASTPVQLLSLPQDPAELHAGAPIRQVEVRAAPEQVRSTVASTPPAFRARSVNQRPDGGLIITWTPDLDAQAPAN